MNITQFISWNSDILYHFIAKNKTAVWKCFFFFVVLVLSRVWYQCGVSAGGVVSAGGIKTKLNSGYGAWPLGNHNAWCNVICSSRRSMMFLVKCGRPRFTITTVALPVTEYSNLSGIQQLKTRFCRSRWADFNAHFHFLFKLDLAYVNVLRSLLEHGDFASLVRVWASRDTTLSRTIFRAVLEQFFFYRAVG